MFFPDQEKRNLKELSIIDANIGGYRIPCHIIAEDKIERRPKKR